MSKKKNKNKPYQAVPLAVAQQTIPELTEAQKSDIVTKGDELQQLTDMHELKVGTELSSEAEAKLKEAEAKQDLPKYWRYLKEVGLKYEALIGKFEQETSKVAKLKEEIEVSGKELRENKIEFKAKLDNYDLKYKELLEKEMAFDNGEYTGVISNLLETLKTTQKTIFGDTEALIMEMSIIHKKNLAQFSEHFKEAATNEKERLALRTEKKKFEVEKEIYEEELKEAYESKFSEELRAKNLELDRLSKNTARLQAENKKLNGLFENLENAFESLKPEEMLSKQSILNEEVDSLRSELNERPSLEELDSKRKQIEQLQSKVKELDSKINEAELLELKRKLFNNDSYIIEINSYKNEIESARVREASLKRTIDDLSKTIDQLKGDSNKKADAFEFAKSCDIDKNDLGIAHLEKKKNHPPNLSDLVVHVQKWMANESDKPFYYSIETIRIFLAGLHMSQISLLQGISGTGKTSLPREFSKALLSDENYSGIDSNNQNKAAYRICAVQSGWRDNMDLMGYYNSFENKYKETDFFKALYLANQPKYQDALFLIILDEMNLSRPEYYFADFLSLLEQSPNERYINLANTPSEVLPDLIKGGRLRIPPNVRFIGTANHDETTLEFAPKTYDRSNLMEMPKNHPKPTSSKGKAEKYDIKYSWLERSFEVAEKKHVESSKKFHEFLNSNVLVSLLAEKGIGIGNRLEFQAEKFIGVYLESGENSASALANAADHLVTSRLFRSLKNRYDLDKTNLTKFKEDYGKSFTAHFKESPTLAMNLLDVEISKK